MRFTFLLLLIVSAGRLTSQADVANELYRTQIAAAEALLQLNKISEARAYLDACTPELRDIEWHFLDAHLDQSSETIKQREGHYQTAVAMHPKGELIATCGSDSTIVVSEYPSMQVKYVLKGHQASVSTLAFNHAGTRLVSGGRDHAVIVWDLTTGKELWKNADDFKQGIYNVCFAPGDIRIAVASWERTNVGVQGYAKLLNAITGKEVLRMNTDGHPAASVAITPDKTKILVATWGEGVYAFDFNNGELIWKYDLSDPDEYNAFHSMALSPDGQMIAAGSTDQRIHFLQASDGKLIRKIESWEGHSKTIKALSFSFDGKFLASGGEDQTIRIWDVTQSTKTASLIGHTQTVTNLCWSMSGEKLFSTSLDGTMKTWDLTDPFEAQYTICDYGPWQTAMSADGAQYIAPCSDKKLMMYGVEGDSLLNFGAHAALCADLSDDGNIAVTAGFDGIVHAWDVQSGGVLKTFRGHTSRVDGVVYLDSIGYIASAGDTMVRIWSLLTGRLEHVIPLKRSALRVDVTPDEKYLVAGCADGTVMIYSGQDWKELHRFSCQGGVQEIAMNPQGKQLAVFSGRDIVLFDLEKMTVQQTLKGHEQLGYGLGFSPDGKYLVTGSYDQTFRFWRLSDGKCTLTYHGCNDSVYTTKFTSDRSLLISSAKGAMRYFRF